MVIGEDGDGGGDDRVENAEDGLWVIHTEGVKELEFFEEAFGEFFWGEIMGDFKGGLVGDAVGLGCNGVIELGLEGFEVFWAEGDAGGHGVPAPGFKKVGALGEGGDEVDPWNGAAGTFDKVAFLGEDEGGEVVGAGDFAGDDANDS